MKNFLKNNKWLLVSSSIAIIFLVIIVILLYTTVFKTDYDILKKDATKKNEEYSELKTKYSTIQKDNEEKNKQIAQLNQQEKQDEINKTIKDLEEKVIKLTEERQSLETQIENLKSDVVKIKGEPKTYPAGHLTAGTDIPIGKYKIYGGSSNFVVYSAYGNLEVNIILGSRYGVEEYIYTFKSGDKIEADSSFKLIEVK